TPVMLMSALGAEQDRISGFTRGADDYLPKPFSLAELDARTDALLRRVRLDRLPSAQRRDTRLVFDDQAQDVLHQGLPAGLTPSEYRLLATLREHAGEALSKPFLYRSVLHRSYTRLDRGLDVHVCNLRRKLAAVAVRHLQIQAVRGQGYLLVETEHP
ncbi:TPA: response regulator transcription factor, partial [Pseudomonas aeruginosa]|nr:response regulator transcription factor [Pseudomonas aeruginosa]